jgi:hypothetical protein
MSQPAESQNAVEINETIELRGTPEFGKGV